MATLVELEMILNTGGEDEQIELLSHLQDVFESYNKYIQDFEKKERVVVEEVLERICYAETYQDT